MTDKHVPSGLHFLGKVEDAISAKSDDICVALGNGSWRTSIADLLSDLGMENDFEARKHLAREIRPEVRYFADTEPMDKWLHRELMFALSKRGRIKVPVELFDILL